MGQKRTAGLFWRTRSELKTLLYGFEDEWRGRVMTAKGVSKPFITQLNQTLKQARAVMDAERQEFFNQMEVKPVDLASTLSSAAKAAGSQVDLWRNSQAAERRQQLEALSRTRKELKLTRTAIQAKEAELQNADDLVAPHLEEALLSLYARLSVLEAQELRLAAEIES